MSLTAEQVRWVAHLARLELTDDELRTMTPQLSAILDYVDLLRQVNTDGVEPLAVDADRRRVRQRERNRRDQGGHGGRCDQSPTRDERREGAKRQSAHVGSHGDNRDTAPR